MVSNKCRSLSALYQGTFWASKQGKLSGAQSSWSAAGQRHKHTAEARYQAKTNVERNPPGSFNHRTQRYCTKRGSTNGDQRSAVYVMLARETRRPMTDLEGGGSDVGGGSLRSCSGSNHRITLLPLSTFSSISPWEKKRKKKSVIQALVLGEVHRWVSVRKHLQAIHLEWVSK